MSVGMIEDAVGAVALLDNFRFRIIPLAEGKNLFSFCKRSLNLKVFSTVSMVPRLVLMNQRGV